MLNIVIPIPMPVNIHCQCIRIGVVSESEINCRLGVVLEDIHKSYSIIHNIPW